MPPEYYRYLLYLATERGNLYHPQLWLMAINSMPENRLIDVALFSHSERMILVANYAVTDSTILDILIHPKPPTSLLAMILTAIFPPLIGFFARIS